MMHYPPFGAMANLIIRSSREEEAITKSAALGRLLSPAPEGVKVMGPAPAAVARVKTEYRFQMLLKTSSRARLNEILGEVRAFVAAEKWGPTTLAIDVDPMTLL
jgi:primosomal protein N' (replication factor Y)